MGRDNVSERILSPRKTTLGAQDALENLVGGALKDGAQCYVIAEQATYRFLAGSELPADGKLIVAPLGKQGRFVRESGLVGLALLEAGQLRHGPEVGTFVEYKALALAQFELLPDGGVRYIGTVPRVAVIDASAVMKSDAVQLYVTIETEAAVVAASDTRDLMQSCMGFRQVMPGDTFKLRVRKHPEQHLPEGSLGSLRIVLV